MNLKAKVRDTALFTPDEKVEILASIDTFVQSDLTELESIIDEYDAKYAQILATFRQNMFEELDSIEQKATPARKAQLSGAIAKIKSGLTAITSK